MTELRRRGSSWQRWAEYWFVVFALGAGWTVLTVPLSGIIASLLLFGICTLVGVGVARDGGSTTPWVVVPVVAIVLTCLLGPLFDEPLVALLLAAVMAASTPPVRTRIIARRARLSVDMLSDWGLEARWGDSEDELRHTDRADQALAVVLRREELLDELVRRRRTPYE
jgi:hypothetical protein